MRTVTAAVLALITLVLFQFIASMPLLSRAGKLEVRDLYVIVSLPLVIGILYLIRQFGNRRRISRGDWTALVGAALISAFSLAAVFMYDETTAPQGAPSLAFDKLAAVYAGIFAAFFASAGWLITNYLNYENARKAHTMNILIQMRNNSIYQDHTYNITLNFPDLGTPISKEQAIEIISEGQLVPQRCKDAGENLKDYKEKIPVDVSLTYILNFFEFIGIGVYTGDLDGNMIKKSLRGVLKHFYKFAYEYIERSRQDDYGAKNERIYEYYRMLVRQYGVDMNS